MDQTLSQHIDDWCKEKSRWWRAILLIVLAREWVNFLSDPLYSSWFSGCWLLLKMRKREAQAQ